jgi:hypothetical protein
MEPLNVHLSNSDVASHFSECSSGLSGQDIGLAFHHCKLLNHELLSTSECSELGLNLLGSEFLSKYFVSIVSGFCDKPLHVCLDHDQSLAFPSEFPSLKIYKL